MVSVPLAEYVRRQAERVLPVSGLPGRRLLRVKMTSGGLGSCRDWGMSN